MKPRSSSTKKKKGSNRSSKKNQDGVVAAEIQEDSPWQCTDCPIKITNNDDMGMECSICNKHYCITCADVSVTQYTAIQELTRDDFIWVCKHCGRDPITKIISPNQGISVVENKVEELKSQIEDLISNLNTEVQNLKMTVNNGLSANNDSFNKTIEQTKSCSDEVKKTFVTA